MLHITTFTELEQWLQLHQIDTSRWGHGDAKTVADLWAELQHGDCTLHNEPPLRRMGVVELLIVNGDHRLIEAAQEFADGRIRVRNRPPSEKVKQGETPTQTARRCLIEELGVDSSRAELLTLPAFETRQEVLESGSFPGLPTLYTFYHFTLQGVDLPAADFITPNIGYVDGDPVIAHHWRWLRR